jgi:hypothetical protein
MKPVAYLYVGFFLTITAIPASAEWVVVKSESAFNTKVDWFAAQFGDDFTFGLVCTMIDPKSVPEYRITYEFPRGLTPEETIDLNHNLHLVLRVDGADAIRTGDVVILPSGVSAMAGTINPPEVYAQLAAAKNRIDVALEIRPGEVYAEHRFEDIGDITPFLAAMAACKGNG